MLPNCSHNVEPGDCLADKRATFKLFDYEDSRLNNHAIFTHKACACNEKIALSKRHQVDDGSRYTSKTCLKKYLRPLIKPSHVATEDYIISKCSGDKRKLMENARDSLQEYDICQKDGQISMFLKDDKYPWDESALEDLFHQTLKQKIATPRCIQYRNKRYCLRLAQYLHAIETNTYAYEDKYGTRVFAKCRNLTQRGKDLRDKWESFVKPKALLLDHSKFDAHCSVELLKLEQWFYLKCRKDSELRKLLKMQNSCRGRTSRGTTYKTHGTRMSGDQNTGLGNSIINYAMLSAFMEHNNITGSIYVDGDDSVIIYEDTGSSFDMNYFTQFGMVTKREDAVDFERVDFCQTRPVFDGTSWHCVRNPVRLMSRTPWTTREQWSKKREVYLASIGRCEIALGMGMPVGQYLGEKLSALSTKSMQTQLDYVARREYVRPGKARVVPPSLECRLSYEAAWGLSPPEQMYLENLSIHLPFEEVYAEEYPCH